MKKYIIQSCALSMVTTTLTMASILFLLGSADGTPGTVGTNVEVALVLVTLANAFFVPWLARQHKFSIIASFVTLTYGIVIIVPLGFAANHYTNIFGEKREVDEFLRAQKTHQTRVDQTQLRFVAEQNKLRDAFSIAMSDLNRTQEFFDLTRDLVNSSPYARDHAFQLADHTTKLLINRIKNADHTSAENVILHYANTIVPLVGKDDKTSDVASNALHLAHTTHNDKLVAIVFDKLLGPNFDITAQINAVLLFNLACHYAIRKQKEPMLKAIKYAMLRGKKAEQFMTDTDFKEYWADRDFLNTLKNFEGAIR